MKTYFLAAFVPSEGKSGFFVFFPDVHGAITEGDTLEEAMDMAEDALATILQKLAAENKDIPKPNALPVVKEKCAKFFEEMGETLPEGILYQLVAAPSLEMVPVRVNVSLPKSILENIDDKAALLGFTRSGFIAKATQAYNVV